MDGKGSRRGKILEHLQKTLDGNLCVKSPVQRRDLNHASFTVEVTHYRLTSFRDVSIAPGKNYPAIQKENPVTRRSWRCRPVDDQEEKAGQQWSDYGDTSDTEHAVGIYTMVSLKTTVRSEAH